MAGLVAAVVQQVLTPEASPSMPSSPTMPVGTGYWFSAITLSLSLSLTHCGSERERETEKGSEQERERERFASFLPIVLLHSRQGPSREAGCLPSELWRLSSVFIFVVYLFVSYIVFYVLCVFPHVHTFTCLCNLRFAQYMYRLFIFTYSIQF